MLDRSDLKLTRIWSVANIPQAELILKIAEFYKIRCFYEIGAYPTKATEYLTRNLIKKGNIDIIAFEPSREGYLRYKSLFGRYKKIKVFNIALGNKSETRNLKITPGKSYIGTFLNAVIKENPFVKDGDVIKNEQVRVELLDRFIKRNHLPGPNIIKIDTMGWEYKTFLGAQKLIRENSSIFIIASYLNFFEYLKDILKILCPPGYDYQKLFHLSALLNKVYNYYIFYPLKEKEKIIEIINELSKKDFSNFYYQILRDKKFK